MEEENADINPPEDFIAEHSAFTNLLTNKRIAARFAEHEAVAVPMKRFYSRFGQLSLLAAFITFTAVIYELTLDPYFSPGALITNTLWFRILLAVVGVAGIGMQVVLLVSPLKHRWLGSRFLAERVRCLKFQAFQEAACAGDKAEEAVERFTRVALGDLSLSTRKPVAAMHEFDPEKALAPIPEKRAPIDPQRLAELKNIYIKLRLNYQAEFAADQAVKLKEKQKLPAAASELSFWGGLTVGYVDVIAQLLPDNPPWLAVLHFFTLWLFMLSALLFVRERGSAFNAAIERYEDYKHALTHVAGKMTEAKTSEQFIDCVREAEYAAMRELKAFCRETDKSTYLF